MKFSDYELLPGIVIDADDPYSLGRVKANVPMLFYETKDIPKAVLPWVYPLMSSGYQKFSKLEIGNKIMVWFNRSNPEEYWYTPMVDMNDQLRNMANTTGSKRGNEVLLCRTGGSNTMINYNDKDGLNINSGDSKITINNETGMQLQNKTAGVTVAGNSIVLAKHDNAKSAEYSIMGQQTQKVLSEVGTKLMNLASLVMSNPYVANLGEPIQQLAQYIIDETKHEKMLSETVKISK